MEWAPHGLSSSGLLQELGHGQSKSTPAVATHRGSLWCLWEDFNGDLWYARTIKEGEFGPRQAFPQGGLPVLANLNGQLHAVIALEATGELVHYCYDADEKLEWDNLGGLDASAGVIAHSTPALVAFHNKLFLTFLRDSQLYLTIWTASDQQWTPPVPLAPDHQLFSGVPALFVLGGVLHLLCADASPDREILGYRYDYIAATWSPCDDVSEGKAASGVSAASYGRNAYLGFIEAGPGDESHAAYVAAYTGGAWQPQESVGGATAACPPQMAVLNGRVHAIFADDTPTRDLRWYSRPALGYSLASWMAAVPDATPLSAMTIPGTHDTCARSSVPFVRTQYLTVTQQLALGIRFLDLRLRVRGEDGGLYCYHGGMPIDLPRYLPFESVMAEVFAFLRPAGRPPTETVLVSINNDDSSEQERADPAPFYAAVADAIARAPPLPDGTSPWLVAPSAAPPTLGAARGRAVLLRRYHADPAVHARAHLGLLDLSAWVNDSADFTIVTPAGARVRLQDKWKYAERMALQELVAHKSSLVQRMMERAAPGWTPAPKSKEEAIVPPAAAEEGEEEGAGGVEADGAEVRPPAEATWFVNFCSAVGDPVEHGEMAEAKWIAVGAHSNFVGKWVDGMNVVTRNYLEERSAGGAGGRQRLGIVPLDYPELPEDNDLVAKLIETNF
ncbi:Phosphatidylinositol-specific phospholipase [Pleurostoma richardsiae]|uniref:Phosphatidylinositol-specific phospholipase n=1 Tax=Pleurostoma richardsiae TaxID=41990 RepID=A0AA38RD14_9PEZI|nr:Phosphatidylinositol-specific phospholipase [Pleurostoma richardsiae]